MSEKREKPFDVQAINPRYRGAMLSDMARVLMLPVDPIQRAEKIAEWKAERRSVTRENVANAEPDVKMAL